jgi:hypothetical protein
MIKAIIIGQVRHLATALGAILATWLIAHGVSASDAGVISAVLLTFVSAASSANDKYHVSKTTIKVPGAGND